MRAPIVGIGIGVPGTSASEFGAISWNPATGPSGLIEFWHADDTPESTTPRWGSDVAGGHLLSAATSPTSPTYTPGVVNGGAGLLFNGTDKVQGAAVADWRLLHDGTGVTVYVEVVPTGTGTTNILVDTSDLSGIGFFLSHDGVNNRFVGSVRNGVGQIAGLTGTGTAPENAPYVVAYSYAESGTPAEAELFYNGVAVAQVNTTGAPSAGVDSVGPLTLGARTSGASSGNAYIRRVLVYNRKHTASEVAFVSQMVPFAASPRRVRRIWCVGESTSFGTYQTRLQERGLLTTTTRIEFLGSLTAGSFPLSNFLNNGYSGQRTDEIQASLQAIGNAAAITAAIGGAPDDILLMACLNDVIDLVAQPTITTNYTALGNLLRGLFPAARLWLGRPNRTLGGTAAATAAAAAACPAIATAVGATYVDTDVAADAEISGDNIHPTAAGYITIANAWATALGI